MKVAIIGAGASGLTAIKSCLDEQLEPVCYERTDDIGGLWNYKEDVQAGQPSVMKSTVINTSKEVMCFSDFPIPAEFPIFMHNKYVQKYFELYAEKFDLTRHIQFHTEVVFIKKHKDFSTTGRWDVRVKDTSTGSTEDLIYDAVLICTGHHADVHRPTFPGLDRFKGKVVHSHDYKRPHGYDDKRIVIIGIGNSGGDVAVELSRVSSQVYLSTRRGTWIWNRISDRGMPVDMINLNRFMVGASQLFPGLVSKYVEHELNKRIDHSTYCLKPNYGAMSQHPMVNDDLPNRIITGSVVIKPNVELFTETGVKFDDGTFADDIDVVVLATGYVFGFPFLDQSVIEVKENRADLYKYMFPPDLEKSTLAVIGFIQPMGAVVPIAELQCRLATRVFKGDAALPSQSKMWEDIEMKKDAMSRRYVKSQRHTIQVDYVPYMDELGLLCGCCPNIKRLFLRDPALAMKCLFGPCTSYQYRLHGPGSWSGARQAIMTQWKRIVKPLKTRPLGFVDQQSQLGFILFYLTFLVIFVLILSIFM